MPSNGQFVALVQALRSDPNFQNEGEPGSGKENVNSWETAIKQAFLPVSQTSSSAGKKSYDATATAPAKEIKPSTVTADEKEGRETESQQCTIKRSYKSYAKAWNAR